MNARIATLVYATLTLMGVTAASNAKGYLTTLGELTFVVSVSAVGLFVAHFWSQLIAHRLTASVSRQYVRREAVLSSLMLAPAVILLAIAALAWLVTDAIDSAVTTAMVGLTAVLFVYTWAGTKAFLWSLGTAAVAAVMIVFKVLV